jgi:hypothetical protein
MTNRAYRFILGLTLLLVIYFELRYVMWAIIGILLFEGLTNLRIPKLVNLALNKTVDPTEGCLGVKFKERTGFEGERAWRLLVASMLYVSYVMFYELLWFFPWFMGFAIFGAGISGVCPMFLMFKWFGFR